MELIKLLPVYYENNETMKTLQSILSEQTDGLDTEMYKTIDNCFVGSASDTLARYERLLGLVPDAAKSDRYRQERIKAKISGAGTTTASLIQNIAESFTSAAVDIVENFPSYTITVCFTGTSGIPGNMSDIKQTIEEAVPAHLKVLYEYIFNTYGAVGTFTHAELAAYTHERIRGGHLKNRIQELQAYQHAELAQLTHNELSKGELPNGN